MTDAHVWLEIVDSDSARRHAWLDADERERQGRLRREADRDRFLVAHTHLRATLSRYAEVGPDAWRFVRSGPRARPRLDPMHRRPDLCFSLAHTPGLVACIVTRGADCGIDVEQEGRVSDPLSVARHAFSEPEREAVERRPSDFLIHWTLKEAYAKASGLGLRAALRGARFDLMGEPKLMGGAPAAWRFIHARPTATHHMAIALGSPRELVVHR